MWSINKGFFCTPWPLSGCSIFLIRAYAVFLFLLQSWLHYNDICAAVLGCILRGSQGISGGLSDFEHWGTIYSPRNSIGRIFWIIWKTKKMHIFVYKRFWQTHPYFHFIWLIADLFMVWFQLLSAFSCLSDDPTAQIYAQTPCVQHCIWLLHELIWSCLASL